MMALAVACWVWRPAAAEPVLINGIVAMVNDKVITREDIEAAVVQDEELLMRQYGRNPQVLRQKREDLRRDQLELLVENVLILHEFETAGFKIPESIIEEHIKSTIRRRYRDRLTFLKTLQSRGLTSESYRQQVRDEFIIRIMTMRNVSSSILISPYKIETYYRQHLDEFKVDDQVKLRMIKLAFKPDRDAEATRRLAADIVTKLDGGASFKEMATTYSDGSQRAEGGEWPWTEPSKLNAKLAPIAEALQPGQRSEVIELSDGYYLMLVEDKSAAHTKILSEVRDEIEKNLQLQEEQRLRKQWIDRLKAKSFVKYLPLG